MTRFSRSAFLLLGLAAMAAPSQARAALRVVTTTPEYAALATAVGGDRLAVTSLAKATEDPHFVDAKPSLIVTLNRADLLIEGGGGLEVGWLPALLEGARNPKVQVGTPGHLFASDGIALLDVPSVLDRSQGDVHAQGNPHFMMDPANAATVARHIADSLCKLDGQGCGTYRANLARFQQTLEAKTREWTSQLAAFRGKPIVTYHTTWRYFAQRFGLASDTFLEPKPGIPPSPPHLAQVIAKMNAQSVRAILVEPYQSRKTAEVVATHTQAKVVDVCQFPGGLPGTGDYFAMMDQNVKAIAAALGS